jgi:hypothetical protein
MKVGALFTLVNQLEKTKKKEIPVDEPTEPIHGPGEPFHAPLPPQPLAGAYILVGQRAPPRSGRSSPDPASCGRIRPPPARIQPSSLGSDRTLPDRAASRRTPPHPR